MKVFITWKDLSGYASASWRALSRMDDIEMKIIAFESDGIETAFSQELVSDLNCTLLNKKDRNNSELISAIVSDFDPDIIVISGWDHQPYINLTKRDQLQSKKFVMTMDNPFRGDFRQFLGKIWLWRYLKKISLVLVPGERGWQLARYLGVPSSKILRGLYGVDFDSFSASYEKRTMLDSGWPKSFIFVGRYHYIKGLDLMINAYKEYKEIVFDPWPLICCGKGEFEESLKNVDGIEDHGFVDPKDLSHLMVRQGVFILPSRYEPWGQAIVESCAAGLPVICSDACGAAVEVVRHYYNGIIVATDNYSSIKSAFCWMHQHHEELPGMGKNSVSLAKPYSTQEWAKRIFYAFTLL